LLTPPQIFDHRLPLPNSNETRRREWLETFRGSDGAAAMLAEAAAEEAAAAAALSVRRVGTIEDLRCLDEDLGTSNPAAAAAAAGGAIAGAAAR
jgi:hypothetical protein